MLIKTPEFDKQFRRDMSQLILNPRKDLIVKGSYSRKEMGSYISDIDITALVWFDKKLLESILKVLENIKQSGTFTFIQFGCGNYKEFIVPWRVDDIGNCKYNFERTKAWFYKLKQLIPLEVYNKIGKLLFGKGVSLQNLTKVETILTPFSEINWTEQTIRDGYVEVRGIRYQLLDEMKLRTPVLEFVYNPRGNEVCSIDVGMVDKRYNTSSLQILYKYYKQDWYSILKVLRWKIKEQYSEEFTVMLKKIEFIVAVKYQVELLENIIKYQLYSERKIRDILTDVMKQVERLSENKLTNKSLSEISNNISKQIQHIAKKYVPYFQARVKDEYALDVKVTYERGLSAEKKIPLDELKTSTLICPFFTTDLEDFKRITQISTRTLIDTNTLADCIAFVAKQYNKTVKDVLREDIPSNNLQLIDEGEEIVLMNENIDIERYPVQDLPHLQKLVLTLPSKNVSYKKQTERESVSEPQNDSIHQRILPEWMKKGKYNNSSGRPVQKRNLLNLPTLTSLLIDNLSLPLSELRDHCKLRNLKCSGTKDELVKRIKEYEKKHGYKNWPRMRKRVEDHERMWNKWGREAKQKSDDSWIGFV